MHDDVGKGGAERGCGKRIHASGLHETFASNCRRGIWLAVGEGATYLSCHSCRSNCVLYLADVVSSSQRTGVVQRIVERRAGGEQHSRVGGLLCGVDAVGHQARRVGGGCLGDACGEVREGVCESGGGITFITNQEEAKL